jgi:hypothetical protein
MNIVRALAGFVLTCLLAACGGGGGSDSSSTPSGGAPSAAAFSIGAAKDGSSVSGFALIPGQTLPMTVKAGEQVRFDSNASVSWSASATNASTNVTTSTGSTWTSTMALTGTSGTVTLVATSTTDTTKSATIVITVEPAFVLTAKLGGVAVASFSVMPGQSQSLDVQSGQSVELSSTGSVTFSSTQTGGVAAPAPAITTTSWTGSLDSKAGAGTNVITVQSSVDPTLTATITINAGVEQFAATVRAVNDYVTYTETETRFDGSTVTYDTTDRVTLVNADKSFLLSTTTAGAIVRMYGMDADGNRLTRTFTNSSSNNYCTYSPKRDKLNYPLYVGKSWTSTWTYSCSSGSHEDAQVTATVDAYEPVTVAAGTFNALRLHTTTATTNSNDTLLLNGSTGQAAYQLDETCWFAPSVGRTVKCTGTYSYTGTAPSGYVKSFVEEAAAVGTTSSSNALNGVYKVMTALGSTLTVAVDLDAKTLAYSANGTTVSGTLAQSGTEWTLSTPSNAVTSTRLVIKDGFLFGALPDHDSTNTFVAATAAGAREDLIVRTADGFAGSYYSLRFSPCLSTASTCVNDAAYPSQLSLTAGATASQATAVSCTQVPTTSTPLKTWLTAEPTASGCLSSATTSTRTWTADTEGMVSSSTVTAPSIFKAMFAKVNGKVTGFSASRSGSGNTTSYQLALMLPITANNSQSYVGSGVVGLMNRTAKSFVQGDYASATGASGSLTFETGTGTFTIQSEALATGVATVNNDANMALFTDGRFGVWFSSSATTGGLSTAFEKFK